MGGILQSDLAWPSQGWTSPARDLRLSRSSRFSSRRSKIETTSKMTPAKGGKEERDRGREPVRTQVVGVSEPRSGGAVSANGAYSWDCLMLVGGLGLCP